MSHSQIVGLERSCDNAILSTSHPDVRWMLNSQTFSDFSWKAVYGFCSFSKIGLIGQVTIGKDGLTNNRYRDWWMMMQSLSQKY